jgi:hypothetical protein
VSALDSPVAVLLGAELAALARRLRAAETRLRDDAATMAVDPDSVPENAARARHEGFAAGVALGAAWLDALRARVPELAAVAARVDSNEEPRA